MAALSPVPGYTLGSVVIYVPIMAFTCSASTMAFWRSCVNTPDAWYAGAETGEETGG